jgi:NAD+ synthase (glutamine-hydrolysing)
MTTWVAVAHSGGSCATLAPMSSLRIALAQVNPTVGDLAGNADIVLEWTAKAQQAGAHVVAFPEMMLTGYPIEDLALRASFQRASRATLDELAPRLATAGLGEITVVVGFLAADESEQPIVTGRPRGGPRNAAAVIRSGVVEAEYVKHHLPNYGVFDEYRYFVPGDDSCTVVVNGARIALSICEDLWQEGGPVADVRTHGADVLLVLNGSPYERSKDDVRLDLVRRRATQTGSTVVYVNMVGGQDELVFDGDSMVVNASGDVLGRAYEFVEELLVVDIPLDAGDTPPILSSIAPELPDPSEVYMALTLGLGDYIRKNGFTSVTLGLSGGIDSALVAAIACDAIGAENVIGVSMPSVYSSQHSKDDARELAERCGLHFREVPIAPMVEAFDASLGLSGLAEENLQARVRGVILMAISNAEGPLVLATGNKSEIAVGYSTIYGDAVGGFAPIKDVPKSLVWELARWRNSAAVERGEVPPIPENSITKPPSAELRPGQLDTDSLPDYAELDELLDAYVERDIGGADLIAAGFDADLVSRIIRLIDLAEYKRRQYPPGTKITYRAFGRDRRLPITSRWRESAT